MNEDMFYTETHPNVIFSFHEDRCSTVVLSSGKHENFQNMIFRSVFHKLSNDHRISPKYRSSEIPERKL